MNVKKLIKLDIFKNPEVLAGKAGIMNKVINVTLIDAPDGYKWYREGDFIVTTGYAFTNSDSWQDGLMHFLERLVEKKCSGIGIKLERYIPFIPEDIINYANKNKIPIISLPNEPSWTDIIVPAVTAINKEQKRELEMTHAVYKKFQNHLKKSGSLDELSILLESIIKLPITIYIKDSNQIVHTDPDIISQKDIVNIAAEVASRKNPTIQTVNYKNNKYTARWIHSSQRLVGGVFVWGLDSDLNAWKKAALEESTIITAVEIERLRTISNTYQHFRNDLLETLIKENSLNYEVISRRAKEVNWDLERRYKIIVLDYNVDQVTKNNNLPRSQYILNMLNDFENELRWQIPKTLVGLDSENRLTLLIPDETIENNLIYNLERVIKTINITYFYGGMGRLNNVESLASSYKEAILALKVAKSNGENKINRESDLTISSYTDLNVERILFAEDPRTESKNLVTEYIYKIIEYDQLKNSEILRTLKVFIHNEANYDDTAKAMFIHKNTVRYRINKVRELTKLNPGKMKDLLILQLAVTSLSFDDFNP